VSDTLPRPPAIPFGAVGTATRRASEAERDNAAMALVGYILGIFKFAPACLPAAYRDGLMERVNAVRRTQGIDRATLVNETAARIRAAAAE